MFFPEKNIVLFIFLFNSRNTDPDNYLISKDEIVNIVHEIINSVSK